MIDKKIIMVIAALQMGGAERVVSLLSQEFVKLGYIVKIVLFDNKIKYPFGGEIIDLKTPPSSYHLVKLFRFLQRTYRLRLLFKAEKPDRIISFIEGSNFPAILTGFEVIVSVHANPLLNYTIYQKLLMKILYRFSNVKKVVTVSKGIEKILNENYHISNTATIYNPVVFENSHLINEDLTSYQPYLLGVGRLDNNKNFKMLIEAYSESLANNQMNLIIAGDGEEKEHLQQLINRLNLEDRVFLVGQKNNISDFYLQCEIFISSSLTEGFGNVIAEALANGCACIATDCPTGPREIIRNNENGLLIANGNQKEMTKAIDRLFDGKDLRIKFKKNAKESVKHLRVESITEKWLRI